VVQIRVTPKTRNPFTIKALSISGVTWKWHFLNHAPPDVDVRAGQAQLAYPGYNPKGIDGIMGLATRTAILVFQRRNDLSESGAFDCDTRRVLKAAAGV